MDLLQADNDRAGTADRQEIAAVTTAPDLQDLEQLIRQFAPVICFHPGETIFPVAVEWYLQKVWLINGTTKDKLPAISNKLAGRMQDDTHYFEPKNGAPLLSEKP